MKLFGLSRSGALHPPGTVKSGCLRHNGLVRFLLLPLFLVVSVSLAAARLYYPHQAGQSWTYGNGETQVVGPPVTYKGVSLVPVNHQFGKILVRQDLMEYRADGSVWLRGVHQNGKLQWYAQPLNVYPPGPLSVGQSWKSGQDSVTVTGVKAVKTAAGTFNALVIATTPRGSRRAQLAYFVPTIGVVGYQTAEGSVVPLVQRK